LGVVKNVATIKSVAVNVYGLNFPHTLSVLLVDHNGVERQYNMGSLNFEGWGELRWDNPAYIQNVRNRDLAVDPIYPDSMPFVRFAGFLIHRQANHRGGDFIAYFQDVRIIHDLAIDDTITPDIDHEGTWHIIETQDTNRRVLDMQNLGVLEFQRAMELDRQAPRDLQFGRRANEQE